MYFQKVRRGGPVHRLFVEFERRIALALGLPKARRNPTAFLWDQNVFNKVHMHTHTHTHTHMGSERLQQGATRARVCACVCVRVCVRACVCVRVRV